MGEAGTCYRRPRVSNQLKGTSGSSSLRSDGSCDGQAGGGLYERRLTLRATLSEDGQMRVGKQLLAVKKPNQKKAERHPNKSQLTLSHGVLMKGKFLAMKMMMWDENQ